MSVAIIGAGLAGLSCAQALAAHGVATSVFEAGAVAGGRLATRKTELGSFDVGAQYFTVRDAEFKDQVAQWQTAGVVLPWAARFTQLGEATAARVAPRAGSGAPAVEEPTRTCYVGVPGMSALATTLGMGLDIRFEKRVDHIERRAGPLGPAWFVGCASDTAQGQTGIRGEIPAEGPIEGPFEAIAIALPAPEALAFLAGVPALLNAARAVRMQPCWALLLAFAEPLLLDYDGAFVNAHRLAWIARDSSKPHRRSGERWVAHARGDWSLEHAEDDPDDVRSKLLKAFCEITGTVVQPLYAAVQFWPHSAPLEPLSATCLWSGDDRMGLCGDWCSGARIEGAWLSGRRLAQQMLAERVGMTHGH